MVGKCVSQSFLVVSASLFYPLESFLTCLGSFHITIPNFVFVFLIPQLLTSHKKQIPTFSFSSNVGISKPTNLPYIHRNLTNFPFSRRPTNASPVDQSHSHTMNLMLVFSIFLTLAMLKLPQIFPASVEEIHPGERDALLRLRDTMNSTLNLHKKWTGPPCYGDQSRWVGIYCSNWHVIHLVLEDIQLTGTLPPNFLKNITMLTKLSFRNNSVSGPLPDLENHVNLRFVILSKNQFSGSIPIEYIDLTRLVQLELETNFITGKLPPFDQKSLMIFNVSDNVLEGEIPGTPVLQSFDASSFGNNEGLCGKPLVNPCPSPFAPPVTPLSPPVAPPSKSRGLEVWNIVLIAVAATVISFAVMLGLVCGYKKVNGKGKDGDDSGVIEERKPQSPRSMADPERIVELEFFTRERPTFDLDDLLRASAEFMGKGKLGSTYKALLESGLVVTVKRLKEMNGLSKKEFVQQMQLLGKMRHENLVEIISFYYSKEEKLVVYEWVSNGSLFELLHGNRGVGRVPLHWSTRLLIVKGIARGLAFLHQAIPSHKLPHGNLKSTNVLLDQHYLAKLTDFGFHPFLPSRKAIEKLAASMSPEFSQGKKLTHKADIYCFGILLLEVITGRIPGPILSVNDDPTEVDLSEWVRNSVNRDWSTDILDLEILAETAGHSEMLTLTEIALECTDTMPEKRPKMSDVLRRIEAIKEEGEGDDDEEAGDVRVEISREEL